MPVCDNCNQAFPTKMLIDGKMRSFQRRRYCLSCSPFGAHNTGRLAAGETIAQRRVRSALKRREESRRLSPQRTSKRRKNQKLRAIAHKGGCCAVCGYKRCAEALEFHHIGPEQKEFTIASRHAYEWQTLEAELEKCVLLCANCHREAEDKAALERSRHSTGDRPITQQRVEKRRREVALRAVALKGRSCALCGYDACARALELHHMDAGKKAFQVRDGNTWGWARVQAELEKCALLCANCHREVEAGLAALPQNIENRIATSPCACAALTSTCRQNESLR